MNKAINERIRTVRKALNLSQVEFSKTIGFTQTGYSDAERGRNNVSEQLKMMLVNFHNVNRAWLEEGKGEMFIPCKSETKKNTDESDTKENSIELLKADIRRLNAERELYIKLLDSKDKLLVLKDETIEILKKHN